MSIQKLERDSGPRWRARILDKDGRQRTKVFKTRSAAEQWEQEMLQIREQSTMPLAVLLGNVEDGRNESAESCEENEAGASTRLTLAALGREWSLDHVQQLAGSTQQRYQEILDQWILPTLGEVPASELDEQKCRIWYRKLREEQGLSARSISLILTIFKGFLAWCWGAGLIPENPSSRLRGPKTQAPVFTFWTRREISQFLAFHEDSHYLVLYLLALNTGMRLGELTGLQWDRLNLQRGTIHVTRSWCNKESRLKEETKGKRKRLVPVPQDLVQLLLQWQEQNPEPWVVTESSGGRLISRHFTQHKFRRACTQAGVRSIRFHDLRHTFASHFMMNGGDLYTLQHLLGHHSISVTEMYAHLSPSYLERAVGVVNFTTGENDADND